MFFKSFSMLRLSKSYLALALTSDRNFKKTHGNRHPIIQLGNGFDLEFYTTSLQSFFMLLKGESATIISAFPYLRALAAPILLPHKITM